MGGGTGASTAAGTALLALYDEALPHVYGYLVSRCGQRGLAEDLTSETFLAAVEATRKPSGAPAPLTQAWLIGVARHKLADHWRRQQRLREHQQSTTVDLAEDLTDDPWDAQLDRLLARQTLRGLSPAHQAALTLRYVDDLPVQQCAAVLDRTVHATEALLVRARRAFRAAYPAAATGEEGPRA
ncbi:sigma-70 family RNA polymerase sigma factor [Rhodococcus sp. X156]|uniref:RNA polymerase sigma factor n=1 Tax=Rhodococcus sp. X156 TaxID=2499145 RepID=UPI000FDAE9AE|nr:sigma-70 family RNA polymerase sigma factor [Rhodococcus sp. X156]